MKGTGELFAMKRLKKTDILSKEQVRVAESNLLPFAIVLVLIWLLPLVMD